MNSRPVGEVMIVQCNGRIVAGSEVFSLQAKERAEVTRIVADLDNGSGPDGHTLTGDPDGDGTTTP
jgi:hypothetical protein